MTLANRLLCAWTVALVTTIAGLVWLGSRPAPAPVLVCVAVALPMMFMLVIGLECAFAAYHNRRAGIAGASIREWWGVWWREAVISMRIFGPWQTLHWRTPADRLGDKHSTRPGVVFVHGFMCNRGLWRQWQYELIEEERPFIAVNLEPVYGSIDAYHEIIDNAVNRMIASTGYAPVLVCHSMGGLAVRAWLRRCGVDGQARVRWIITLGTPHQGTWLARFARARNARQMQRNSTWLSTLQTGESPEILTRMTCWYSNCDNIVFPASSGMLPGAEGHLASARGHLELATDPAVRTWCLDRIRALDGDRPPA